jgi:hypothetical protein
LLFARYEEGGSIFTRSNPLRMRILPTLLSLVQLVLLVILLLAFFDPYALTALPWQLACCALLLIAITLWKKQRGWS